jgi:hypothetical protein
VSEKINFIRDFIIRKAPEKQALDDVINHAEALWQGLTDRGYGDKKSLPIAAKTDSFLSAMTAEQRVYFDTFWDVFNYKKGREQAAKEWLKLNFDLMLYQKIIAAAKREAATKLQAGQVRKMAQGWLSDKRYEDEHYETHQSNTPKLSAVDRVRAANGVNQSAF